MNTSDFRPGGPPGRGDKYLREVAQAVQRDIRAAQRDYRNDTLRLGPADLAELSLILAEFAEDLHNDIGIWRTYEDYNRQWFGIPLPITEGSAEADASAITADRVRHLLWVLLTILQPDLILGPTHEDLARLADVVAHALSARIASVPRDSGVKRFLDTPHECAWDLKRKLIWLGTRSYLFRTACRQYLAKNKDETESGVIAQTDDFICQQCSPWSGLGVLDILAGMLPLTEEQRTVLRGWYERHAALYRVDAKEDEVLEVTNLISDQPYRVMMGAGPNPFQPGHMVFGSLVPWGAFWYWSGTQRRYQALNEDAVAQFRQSMIAKSSFMVYRYRKDLLAKAVESTERHYREFLDYHGGKDLVCYPDGRSMVEDEQRRFRLMYERESRETVDRIMAAQGLKNPWPKLTYADDILNCTAGIGLYYNPKEGMEIMTGFNDLLGGFVKQGRDLDGDDAEAIRAFITSSAISPSFVHRMEREHGDASIRAAFLLRDRGHAYAVEYLLRRYKGFAFRNVYPSLSMMP